MENAKTYDWNSGLDVILDKLKSETEQSRAGEPLIAVIAGGTCSGKTVLAEILLNRLGSDMVVVVSLDSYYKDVRDSSFPRNENGRAILDHPAAYRSEGFIQAINNLGAGQEIYLPEYDMETNTYLGPRGTKLYPRQIIVAEGLFAIKFLTAFKKQLKVYLRINYQNALNRRIIRDTKKYKVTPAQVTKAFDEKVWPNQIMFVDEQAENADLIINY